jgi:hypothetical protein
MDANNETKARKTQDRAKSIEELRNELTALQEMHSAPVPDVEEIFTEMAGENRDSALVKMLGEDAVRAIAEKSHKTAVANRDNTNKERISTLEEVIGVKEIPPKFSGTMENSLRNKEFLAYIRSRVPSRKGNIVRYFAEIDISTGKVVKDSVSFPRSKDVEDKPETAVTA